MAVSYPDSWRTAEAGRVLGEPLGRGSYLGSWKPLVSGDQTQDKVALVHLGKLCPENQVGNPDLYSGVACPGNSVECSVA